MPIADVVTLVQSLKLDSESINNWKTALKEPSRNTYQRTRAKGKCSECHSENLVYEEGCLICKDCGSRNAGSWPDFITPSSFPIFSNALTSLVNMFLS